MSDLDPTSVLDYHDVLTLNVPPNMLYVIIWFFFHRRKSFIILDVNLSKEEDV